MIKAILIDDEPTSLDALKLKIGQVDAQVDILSTFFSAQEALPALKDLDPDVIFLDVEMPEMNAFHFLDQLPHRTFEVIITTAHDEYAIQAVRQSVVDFLLKPINSSELAFAIDRVKQKIKAKKQNQSGSTHKINALFDKIPVPSMRGLLFLPVKDILYLSADGNYTTIHMANKQKIISSKLLKEYESMLDSLFFYRIHHSTILNLSYIKEYIKGEGGSVLLTDGTSLEVSKRKKKEFLEVLGL
ncbi:MAG: LytTR family DNA-binding domain-containing protein [Saprospiraceae bacterium]